MLDVAVVWLQRDLRLHDNPALTAALLSARQLVIVYIWAPQQEGQFQPARSSRWWLFNSLRSLEEQIKAKGGLLCYRCGTCAAQELLDVCRTVGAGVVFFNNGFDPLSLVRDHSLKNQLQQHGIHARSFNAELLFEPWTVLDADGKPFTTFQGFWDKCTNDMGSVPEPSYVEPPRLPVVQMSELYKLSLQDLKLVLPSEVGLNMFIDKEWSPGTGGALRLLVQFLEQKLPKFEHDRAKMDRESTSSLSPHIHFGEVSVRMIYHEALRRARGDSPAGPCGMRCVQDFLQQLGYREYSRYLSFHFPFTHERSLLEHVRAVPWVHCPMRFKAWRQGNTGYPIVDAAMRQLWAVGWMHNRARVFTASFLVKNLLLPWQWGLKHFWEMLLDADLECDALGWQYVTGCLQDARPFHYMMNMEQESKRFDPQGDFVKQWLPELARLPLEYVHMPWTAPQGVLKAANVRLGEDYPLPIVTLSESRSSLDRAYGLISKCLSIRTVNPEPYRTPTVPVELGLLEPEEEVEQATASTATALVRCTQTSSVPKSWTMSQVHARNSQAGQGSSVQLETDCLRPRKIAKLEALPQAASPAAAECVLQCPPVQLRGEMYDVQTVLPDISGIIREANRSAPGMELSANLESTCSRAVQPVGSDRLDGVGSTVHSSATVQPSGGHEPCSSQFQTGGLSARGSPWKEGEEEKAGFDRQGGDKAWLPTCSPTADDSDQQSGLDSNVSTT